MSGGSRLYSDRPRSDVHRVRVEGALDAAIGGQLLSHVDAQLHLVTYGSALTRHLLVDLSAVAASTPRGIRALQQARSMVERRGVRLQLVGAARLGCHLTPGERAVLRGLRNYPDLDAALRGLPVKNGGTGSAPTTATAGA